MVSARRARVFILMASAFIICVVFVGFRRTQQNRDTSTFLKNVDEKSRLDPEIKKDAGIPVAPPAGAAGKAKDLTNDPGQPFNPEKEFAALLNEAPIVVFSKSYCPHCKGLKDVLAEYQITPRPWVVELDMHPHGQQLQEYVAEKTGRQTVPNVLIGGLSRGGGDDFQELHRNGELAKTMQEWAGSSFRIKKLSPKPGSGPGS